MEFSSQPGLSLQEWARKTRFDWFYSVSGPGDWIVLGHNENDLAENALLRMARGSGVHNLGGMSQIKSPLWRPLLDVDRPTIEQIAHRQKIPHREDSSNAKLEYSRNRIRHIVLQELNQLYPGATQRIANLVREAEDLRCLALDKAGSKYLMYEDQCITCTSSLFL